MTFARSLRRLFVGSFGAGKANIYWSKAPRPRFRPNVRPLLEALEERVLLSGLPSPWSDMDVGTLAVQGSASYAATSQTFTIDGAGTGTGGTLDQFNFA